MIIVTDVFRDRNTLLIGSSSKKEKKKKHTWVAAIVNIISLSLLYSAHLLNICVCSLVYVWLNVCEAVGEGLQWLTPLWLTV